MTTENNNDALDQSSDLLDMVLEDIADLPEFKNFPVGAYRCAVTMESKKIGAHPAVEVQLKLMEVLELANPEDTPPKESDTCNASFMLDNEYGLANFKKVAAKFADLAGSSQLRTIVDAVKDIDCTVLTGLRADKKYNALPENANSPRFFLELKEIAVN